MVTSGKTNANNNTVNIKNNASDPVLDSINPDTNTNTTTLAHTSAITTHTPSGSRNYNNSNSNINDNNFTTTSNDDTSTTATTTITSDTLNKVIDDVTNNDVHNVNNEVLCIVGNDEEVKNVAAVVMSDNVTQQNIQLLPKPSPSPQVIIIPRTTNPASTVATNAAKKIRRAFSMPRNPFRWTHKMKTSAARATNQSSNCTSEHKTGRTQDSGGGGGGMNFSAISKSYTLSSCVGGKRERADSFLSLNSNDDNNDGSHANTNNKNHNNTSISSTNAIIGSKDTQSQSCMMPSKKQEEQQQESNDFTKNSNKKFTTKSNTIHGVSSLSSPNAASTTLANGGASLSSTMPAGTSNNNNNNYNNNNNRIFRRSSFRKFLNRIAQHVTASKSAERNPPKKCFLIFRFDV